VFEEILNREFVLQALSQVQVQLSLMATSSDRRSALKGLPPTFVDLGTQELEGAADALESARIKEEAVSSGQEGFDFVPQEDRRRSARAPAPLDSRVFLSRNSDISALQSALDEYFSRRAPDHKREERISSDRRDFRGSDSDRVMVTDKRIATRGDRRIFDQFSVTDVRWVACLFAEARRKVSGRHPFVGSPPSHTLPSRGRLVLVGDWGTGLPRAIRVAQCMKRHLALGLGQNLAQHTIHLGDTYYSGWPGEYERRFLPHWPVGPELAGRINSWSLNANHDMYSGGFGYYETLLRDSRFACHNSCSYFSLQSPFWRVIAIDTGWEDGGIEDSQTGWLRNECEAARAQNQRVLLLSHHQLFSSYEAQGTPIEAKVKDLVRGNMIRAWIWGHEHRCMVYGPHAGLPYAACIGHGGVPVYMNHAETDPYPEPGIFEDRRFIQHGLERWAYMGFCVVDFDERSCRIRFIDENDLEVRVDSIG
jgi:Calcineurin-like phosphoesterase